MKILTMGFVIPLMVSLLLITGCASTTPTVAYDANPSVSGSRWHYIDQQWEYDITFMPNGVLQSRHPHDKTPNDDAWEQNGTEVRFYFNNKYSRYQGTMAGHNLMSGTATNKRNKSWTWKATRVD
jgi:hypothetical protein